MSADLHLNDQQMALAALEGSQAPDQVREHLQACPQCQAQVRELAQALTGLSAGARGRAPAPPVSWVRPARPSRAGALGRRAWAGVGGLALAAALIMVLWLPGAGRLAGQLDTMALVPAAVSDENWLAALGLEESEDCQGFLCFVAGEDRPEVEGQFMEFLVPPGGGDLSSNQITTRSEESC